MAVFRDFNFKLLVVEQLMYIDETLTPRFSIEDHMRARGIDDLHAYVEENDLEYQVLDEARAYFERLEIGDDLLASVKRLTFDGGNKVFMECAPVWDGEDDLFDVRSLDDLELVPNLKRFLGARSLTLTVPDASETLRARGIETIA
ncbi:DUF6892 domain-containing protein [Streptomyces sp. NPDC001750]|uniref:DUF6892 domain-containing protein n=1 Tax=Streptomyces sp. NPDC001750 TaxID=3364607 RepID=UPI0036B92E7C